MAGHTPGPRTRVKQVSSHGGVSMGPSCGHSQQTHRQVRIRATLGPDGPSEPLPRVRPERQSRILFYSRQMASRQGLESGQPENDPGCNNAKRPPLCVSAYTRGFGTDPVFLPDPTEGHTTTRRIGLATG